MADESPLTRAEISRRQMVFGTIGGAAALAGTGTLSDLTSLAARASSARPRVFCWMSGGEPASLASLRRNATALTHVSPTWYQMRPDLSIAGTPDQMLVDFIRHHSLSLHPAIGNTLSASTAQAILGSSDARARAAQNIAELVLRQGFDGINMDFEGDYGQYRDQYSDLIDRIAAHLRPMGKALSVDVPPNQPPTAWSAAYNYARLGQTCDAVVLLAYDYSVQKPGSIAPLWWVKKAVSHAQSQIPAAKLVVGLPFFGRHWIQSGGKFSATPPLTHSQALDLLVWSGTTVSRPALDATPRFSWPDGATRHIVHYEDAQSLTAKLASLDSHLGGVAFWRLGLEDRKQWGPINSWVHQRMAE